MKRESFRFTFIEKLEGSVNSYALVSGKMNASTNTNERPLIA